MYFDASNTWIKPEPGNKFEETYWDIGTGYFYEPSSTTSLDLELYYGESKEEDMDKIPQLYFYSRFDFLKDKDVKPYIGFDYSRNLNHFTKNSSGNQMSFFAGAWKKFDNKILLKGSLTALYKHSFPESTRVYFGIETGYQFNKNLAVTIYDETLVYNHNVQNIDIDSSFTGGILLKYLF
ncbi:MAG: hypothetical protein J5706_00805 [Elusimicrobiales bacterium]|nr:hypothetical protein [Elusimicrobiales bacterium]